MYPYQIVCHTGYIIYFYLFQDTQFSGILNDSLEFFNIPDDQHSSYFLVDTKTRTYFSQTQPIYFLIQCFIIIGFSSYCFRSNA